MNKKIVFMGTSNFAVPILKSLYQNGYPISVVYTQPPKKSNRGLKLSKSPINLFADNITLDVGAVTGYVYDIVPMARLRYKDFFVMPAFEVDNKTGLVFGVQFNLLGGKDE